MNTLFLIMPVLVAYLIGSIPFGLIVGKLGGVGDIRKIGSGNIGATNMLRTGKKSLALLTLLLDGAKGYIACKVAVYFIVLSPEEDVIRNTMYIAGIFAVLGHLFPLWLSFKGGKGVATTLGVFFAIDPLIGALTCMLWLVVFYLTRFSSLAAIISISISPVLAFFVDPYFALMALVVAVFVIVKHKENIKRLMQGSETKWRKSNEPS